MTSSYDSNPWGANVTKGLREGGRSQTAPGNLPGKLHGTEGVSGGLQLPLDDVLAYLANHGFTRPYIIAKVLRLDEPTVLACLRELEGQGKVRLRSANIEWRSRSRRHVSVSYSSTS